MSRCNTQTHTHLALNTPTIMEVGKEVKMTWSQHEYHLLTLSQMAASSGDNQISKHNLFTIPTEMLELIASFLDFEDFSNLHLVNRQVCDKTFYVLTDKFFDNFVLDPRSVVEVQEANHRSSPQSEVCARCQTLRDLFDTTKRILYPEQVAKGTQLLSNLRSLPLSDLVGFFALTKAKIKLPDSSRSH